jgi:sporulation protein YlmC with PRC-barrel domain
MKSHHIAAWAAVCSVALLGTLAAVAQQTTTTERANQTGQNQATADTRSGAAGANKDLSKLDDKTRGATIRASQLNGMDIKNSNGDDIGEVQDLVIDSSGKVRYVAVQYGGFLGLGSKLFAVPFEAFKVRQDPDDPDDNDDYVLTLDVTKDQLEGDQGFDDDSWPDFADTKLTQDLDRRYNVNRSQTGGQSTR